LSAHLTDLKAGAALLLERETITPEDFPPIARQAESHVAATDRAAPSKTRQAEGGSQ